MNLGRADGGEGRVCHGGKMGGGLKTTKNYSSQKLVERDW